MSAFESYGFVDPGSLVAFTNPFSPNPAITAALAGEKPALGEARALYGRLARREDQADLVMRLSVSVHERQHFHDLLLSPFGGRLFRAHLAVRLEAVRLYALLVGEGRRGTLRIPLDRDSGLSETDLQRVRGWYERALSIADSGRQTLEANAVLSQRIFVWDTLGVDALDALDEELSKSLVYSRTYHRLDKLAEEALRRRIPIVAAARLLFTAALAQERPDDHLEEALWLLETAVEGTIALRQLDQLCQERLERFLDASKASIRAGVAVAAQIANNMPPSDGRDVLIEAVLDLVHLAEDLSAALREHPDRLGTEAGLLDWPRGDPLPEPLVCWYCTTDDYGLSSGTWELANEHPLEEVKVWAETESGPMFVPRLIADAFRFGDRVQQVELAMELAELGGSEALLRSDVSLTHPLHGLFIRKARKRQLDLVRR